MEIESVTLSVRLGIHVLTAAIVGSYVGNPQRQRTWVQFTAFLIAGSSAAAAFQILTTWDDIMSTGAGPQPWLVIICGGFLVAVVMSGGNIAKLFDLTTQFNWPWKHRS